MNLPQIAADEYRRRKAANLQALAERKRSAAQVEQTLRTYLAIACAAGATGAHLDELAVDEDSAALTPSDFAPRSAWAAELGRARDKAIEAQEREPTAANILRARGLIALAQALAFTGTPPVPPCMARPQLRRPASEWATQQKDAA